MVSWILRTTSTISNTSWKLRPKRAATKPVHLPSASPRRSSRPPGSFCWRHCLWLRARSPATSHRARLMCACADATPSSLSRHHRSAQRLRTLPKARTRPPSRPAKRFRVTLRKVVRHEPRCACPTTSRCGSRRLPSEKGSRSTPGSCVPSLQRWSPRTAAPQRGPHEAATDIPAGFASTTRLSIPVPARGGVNTNHLKGSTAMPVFTTPEPIYVTIELSAGDVRIIASDRTDTVIKVRPRDDSKASDIKAAEQTQVEYASGRLLVKSRQRNFIYEGARSVIGPGRGSSVDVTIELPTGSHVQGDSGMGDYGGEGELGECRFKTGMGNIRLDHPSALHLKTGMGNIAVDRALGDAYVTTGSGDVRIGTIEGAAVIKNSNGDTVVGEVTGDLRVKSANGRISIDRAHASVIAKTANGNVRIGEVMRGAIVLETAAGELQVGIREGTAAWLDVSSHHGRVRNSLDEADSPEQSEATVEIRARTSYGDILIHRSNQTTQTGN